MEKMQEEEEEVNEEKEEEKEEEEEGVLRPFIILGIRLQSARQNRDDPSKRNLVKHMNISLPLKS